MKPLRLGPAAARELAGAVAGCAERSPDHAARLLIALDETFQLLRQEPLVFPLVHPPLRRCLVPQHPYVIYYQDQPEQVSVVAVVASGHPARRGGREARP